MLDYYEEEKLYHDFLYEDMIIDPADEIGSVYEAKGHFVFPKSKTSSTESHLQ